MGADKNAVLTFWFDELKPQQWWAKDEKLDQIIKERFSDTLEQARQCELSFWRADPLGRLAEIIVLDQFSRNIFRGDYRSFAQDPLALALSQESVTSGAVKELSANKRHFSYIPYMHSESKLIHQQAVELYADPELEHYREFEIKHKAIIDRFGRYPHRNEILGRESTPEEIEFLKGPDSSF